MGVLQTGQHFKPIVAGKNALDFSGCIISDLLSYVMQKGNPGQIWVTHHGHPNIAAVALLKEFAAVIIAGGGAPDQETILRARENGLVLLATDLEAYDIAFVIKQLEQ
jgi:predicted transcriptional regulator